MKRISKLAQLVLGFVAGTLSGAFIRLGFEMVGGHSVSVGGEALILPLIVLLIIFGFFLGKEFAAQRKAIRAYARGYQQGYVDGVAQMGREVEYELSHNVGGAQPYPSVQSGL